MDKKWKIVFDYLMYLIKENKVGSGEVLPSQNMLKTKFHYSEQPIRIAFNKLIELKIVKSISGKGFVVQDKISNNLLFSFRELFPETTSVFIDFYEFTCNDDLARESSFKLNDKLYKFKCIRRTKEKEIILLQESFVKKDKFPNLTLEILNSIGFMNFIETYTSSIISHSSKKISFINLTSDLIEKFQIEDEEINGFIIDVGKVYDIYGDLLEFRKSYYKPIFFEWDFIEWRK